MSAEILKADATGIARAIQLLREGAVTLLPTENVYGFFVNGDYPESVQRVCDIKHRDAHKPFVLFVTKSTCAQYGHLTAEASRIVQACWPAPVSVVVKKTDRITPDLTRGLDTVAMMCVESVVIRRVCEAVEAPVFGTTCNYSGEPEIKTSKVAIEQFADRVDLIVEGDHLIRFGKPSTIVDFTVAPPKVIRHGGIPAQELRDKYLPNLSWQ